MNSHTPVKTRIVVLISGRGSNLRALQEFAARADAAYEIVAVISDKAKAAGLEFAESEGIPTRHIPRQPKLLSASEFAKSLADCVASFEPDYVVLAGFMRILGEEFISCFPQRIINIHPSLLPAFPGLDVQQQAIDAGVRFSGCSVHLVIPEVDAGRILAQAVVPVLPDDDAELLAARILKQEHKLFPMVLQALALGQIKIKGEIGKETILYSDEILPDQKNSFFLSIRQAAAQK